ncbi:MAG: hypothetical protein Q4C95_01485 [Planctomycetia bacterium]|nr:hypothetical protein [Planctomycetia bacterium]
MTIRVTCPNGHKLAVKKSRAGTMGICPACEAKFQIPELKQETVTESSIMRILGIGDMLRGKNDDSVANKSFIEAGPGIMSVTATASKPSSTNLKKTQVCPQCDWEIDAGYHICPHCRYYLMGNTGEY